jgi:cell division initiation protein
MMDLTPLEVRQKKGDFRRAMRGYDADLVNDFLDIVADRLESLVRENMQLAERLILLEEQVTEYRERERAMTEALVSAQEMREELRGQAARDAELSRREAELDASRIRSAAVQEAEREREALTRLKARRTQIVRTYRSFLERELAELGVMEQALAAEPDPKTLEPTTPARRQPTRAAPAPAAARPAAEGGTPEIPFELPSQEPPTEAEAQAAWSAEVLQEKEAAEAPPAQTRAKAADREMGRDKEVPPAGQQKDWLSSILEDRS